MARQRLGTAASRSSDTIVRSELDLATGPKPTYAEVTQIGQNQTIPASQFTEVMMSEITADLDNLITANKSEFRVPSTGIYTITGLIRIPDDDKRVQNFGIGAHASNFDGPWFQWNVTRADDVTPIRQSFSYRRTAMFIKDDLIRLYVWSGSGITIERAQMTVSGPGAVASTAIIQGTLPSYLSQPNLDAAYLKRPASGSKDQVLTRQDDGSALWAPSPMRVVVEHGAVTNVIRPATTAPVTWIGSVQPTYWIDGDDWYEASGIVVDLPTANLVNYWRAEDLALSSGQAVTTLANRVANGPALTAAGGPVFDIENGVSSILFDGVDDHMSETVTSIAQPTTTISVGRFVVAAASKPWISGTNIHGISSSSGSKWSINAGSSLLHTTNVDTKWRMVASVFNGTSTIVYVDGLAVTGSGGTNGRTATRVAANSGLSSFANMKFVAMAQYSRAMTTTELDNIRANLRVRYPFLSS